MAIVVIIRDPPNQEPERNLRLGALKDDIRQIIRDKVEYCEIVDAPYRENSLREHLRTAINLVCMEYCEENFLNISEYRDQLAGAFLVRSKVRDGVRHFYVSFSFRLWERILKNARGEGEA